MMPAAEHVERPGQAGPKNRAYERRSQARTTGCSHAPEKIASRPLLTKTDRVQSWGEPTQPAARAAEGPEPARNDVVPAVVFGDGMAPGLIDGDTVMVDRRICGIDCEGVYLLRAFGRTVIKRVQPLLSGGLLIISDNARYQRETLARDQAGNVEVLGRVVWPRL